VVVFQPSARQQYWWNAAYRAGPTEGDVGLVRAPHPLALVPSHLRHSCSCVAERRGLWWWSRDANDNNIEGSLPTELGLLTELSYL